MYIFSNETVAEFYGRKFYSIANSEGKIVAYSEKVFDVPETVRFLAEGRCLIFEKAVILGGTFRGGDFRGGTFLGGDFRGGTFRGGDFRGGTFLGGDFRGGTYEVSMLQIQGSRHLLYAYFNEENAIELGIGCERHPIPWWQENYEQIGIDSSYTKDEIKEYSHYIELFAARYQNKV